jgi:molecular chaperone DnaK
MAPVVGIDLGTTNTVVAVVRDGQAAALADETGEKLIPSVVSFHPSGSVLVGRKAKERRLIDARNTIYSVKRLIGRSWDSEEVRKARSRFAFEMREGPGQAALVVARGETYTLPEISAFVLRKAKSSAEAALGTQIDRAVITVPANFNDLQRAATKVAGRVAGLDVLRIVNEPTAAALAYGYGKDSSERLAVYDFGGGTFDVTLLDLSDNVFEVLATAGNTFLGGDDIDIAIAERMAEAFLAEHRYDVHTDPQAFERLRASAETLKMRLSSLPETSVDIAEVAHGAGGKALGLTFSMTRQDLEHLISPIVDRTFDVCREALGVARLDASSFDQILLVGGSTRIPLVRQRVEEFFKRTALGNISPDEVVAIGAAIQASALTGAERRRGDIPPPPTPAARRSQPSIARKSRPPPLPKRRGGTLPPGARAPSSPDFSQGEPHTAPYGRERMPTSPGLQPGSGVKPLPDTGGGPMVVVPPGARRSDVPARNTLDGLAERSRVPTGTGLGPEASRATTLASASDAAEQARRVSHAEIPLPLIGSEDAAQDDVTVPNLPPADALSPDEVAAKYGKLPLVMPGAPPDVAPEEVTTQIDSAQLRAMSAPMSTEEVTAVRRPRASAPTLDESEQSLPVPGLPSAEPGGWGPPPPPPARPSSRPPPAYAPLGAPREKLPSVAPVIQELGLVPAPAHAMPRAPLLVDVTPLTLSVETVSGFCDTIIERNTPVPCERTRAFVTAADNQTSVRVRVSQGESARFSDNTLLGQLELSGLRPAPRGQVEIAVTFALDTDGILNVRATDVATGHATAARVRLVGMPEAADVSQMVERQAAYPGL